MPLRRVQRIVEVITLVVLAGEAAVMLTTVLLAAAALAILRIFDRKRTQRNESQDHVTSA